ncbi:MAG TPA: hypothetical protein VEG34_18555, partial [Thermoanaerobaculia bacterium]|nr:hypothetical protein [Thermoanaerobaculia bacterium]
MILIEPHRIGSYAGVGGGRVDDRQHAPDGPQFVIGGGGDAELERVVAVPIEKVAEVRIMRAELLDADGRTEDGPKCVQQRGQLSAGMRRGKEQDRPRVARHLLLAGIGGVGRLSEDLLGEQAAEAV